MIMNSCIIFPNQWKFISISHLTLSWVWKVRAKPHCGQTVNRREGRSPHSQTKTAININGGFHWDAAGTSAGFHFCYDIRVWTGNVFESDGDAASIPSIELIPRIISRAQMSRLEFKSSAN